MQRQCQSPGQSVLGGVARARARALLAASPRGGQKLVSLPSRAPPRLALLNPSLSLFPLETKQKVRIQQQQKARENELHASAVRAKSRLTRAGRRGQVFIRQLGCDRGKSGPRASSPGEKVANCFRIRGVEGEGALPARGAHNNFESDLEMPHARRPGPRGSFARRRTRGNT